MVVFLPPGVEPGDVVTLADGSCAQFVKKEDLGRRMARRDKPLLLITKVSDGKTYEFEDGKFKKETWAVRFAKLPKSNAWREGFFRKIEE